MNNGGTETHSQSIFMDRNLSGHQLSNRHSIASRQSDKNTDDDDNDEDTALLSSSSSMKKKPMYTLTTTTPTTFSGAKSERWKVLQKYVNDDDELDLRWIPGDLQSHVRSLAEDEEDGNGLGKGSSEEKEDDDDEKESASGLL